MCAATGAAVFRNRAAWSVAAEVKRQMHLERKMYVHGAREKRENAQREPNDEAEQINIRPGHATPQNAALLFTLRELEFETGPFLPATVFRRR
jgi:hypothetical protein